MSKITEYINLAIKGIPHTKEILSSVINNVQMKYNTLPEEDRVEIVRRRLICHTCPFMSQNTKKTNDYKELTGKDYETSRNSPHCSFCGCNIEMRTSSLHSNCGIEVWNKENSEKTIPLKWNKIHDDGKEASS